MVAPEAVARLDPSGATLYGVSWWNKHRTSVEQVSEGGPDGAGRRYRRKRTAVLKPRDEWIAARAGIKDNKPCSSAGGRFWELSGGVLVCGDCGKSMIPEKRRRSPDSDNWFLYYRCSVRRGIE